MDKKGDTQQNQSYTTLKRALAALALAICAAVAVFAVTKAIKEERLAREQARLAIINSGVFHDGIIVQGVRVGGMTLEQAKEALKESERELSGGVAFALTLNGEEYFPVAEDFGISFDTEDVLNEAMAIGREGTLDELREQLAELSAANRSFPITYKPDDMAVLEFVTALAKVVYLPPQNARLTSIKEPENLTDDEKGSGDFVNAASTTSAEERLSPVAETDGIALDSMALYRELTDMLEKREYHDIELPVVALKADITLDNIDSRVTLRGKASTSYAKSPYNRSSRVYNIRKAVSLINGTVVEPNEVFSINDALGYRTYESGWKGAPAIVAGTTEEQAGGGVCQVSTTMYLCALSSDLEVIDRRGHSSKIGYVAGGLDATIDSGHIDFQWRNNTSETVYVFAWVDTKKKTVNFEIYGEPFPEEFDEVKVSSKKISTVSPDKPMKYIVDKSKEPGYSKVNIARKYGSVWESYVTYLKNGETVDKKTVDRTTYKAYAGETVIGPKPVEPVEEG